MGETSVVWSETVFGEQKVVGGGGDSFLDDLITWQ